MTKHRPPIWSPPICGWLYELKWDGSAYIYDEGGLHVSHTLPSAGVSSRHKILIILSITRSRPRGQLMLDSPVIMSTRMCDFKNGLRRVWAETIERFEHLLDLELEKGKLIRERADWLEGEEDGDQD